MAKVTIKGGPLLKARLDGIPAEAGPVIMATWAQDAARLIKAGAPRRTGRLAESIKPGTKGAVGRKRGFGPAAGVRAAVFGAYWAIFIDRGTKAHEIQPRKGRKSTTGRGAPALQFTGRSDTIFRKRALVRRMRRRPFITQGAQEALRRSPWADKVIQAWNRKKETSGFNRLTL